MSDKIVPENDLPVADSNEVPESDLPGAKKSKPTPESKTAGAIAGAAIGVPVASAVASKQVLGAIGDALRGSAAAPKGSVSVSAAPPTPAPVPAPAPVMSEHGFHQGAVSNAQFNEQQRAANKLTSGLSATPEPGFQVEGNRRIMTPINPAEERAAMQLAKEKAAQEAAQIQAQKYLAAKEAEAAAKAAKPTMLQTVGKALTPTGIPGKVLNTVAPVLSLAGTGAEAVDAYNRAQQGDYGRAVISGLGAIGSAAAMIPHPATRAIGTGVALAAPVINMGIDALLGRDYAEGGTVQGYAEGNSVGPYVGYPQIRNKPRDPNFVQQSGPFLGGLDAVLGMGKRGDVSIMTPEGQAYHSAYEKLEPAGIAASVLPFIGGPTKALGKSAARTLGPKASDMAEGYLSRMGGLQYAVPNDTKIVRASEALNPYADKGLKLGLTQSDNFGVHGGRFGGNRFPTLQEKSPLHAKDRVVWMNDTEEHANKMIDQAKNNDLLWSTYIGAPNQLKSNKSVTNEILNEHYARNLTPEQIAMINNRIANVKDSKKRLIFPEPFDIRDKFAVQELGTDTFARRGELADILGEGIGVGRTKGGIALPNYQDILRANRDPLTEGVPTSSIGTQLFKVDPNKPSKFSTDYHPDYNYTVYGKNTGVTMSPFPHSALDWHDAQVAKTGSIPHGNAWFNYMNTPQEINDKFLSKLHKIGHAAGGSIRGYQAGRIVRAASDLILPAAENAARTQIIGTLPTYGKAAEMLAQRGASGQAIDFGAGLGKGAELLGPGTHTYEPFAKNWTPTFSNAADVPSDAYGRLTNLNVLNVVPREARDEIVQHVGRVMQPGGQGIITTRGADVMKAQGRPGPEPTSIITSRDTYQKGFTKQELEDYMRYMLGDKFDVNKVNLGPAGVHIQKKAEGGEVTETPTTSEPTPIMSQLLASAKENGYFL